VDAAASEPSQPWLPNAVDASWLGGEGQPPRADGGAEAGASDLPAVSPVGGLWVSCYGGFRPTGQPVKDVARLGMMCGPPNGMQLVDAGPMTGAVDAAAKPVTHRFSAQRGACYRVFAVAEPGVSDLDVAVRSSRGSRLATDHSEDCWPIVDPDRPFCTFDDDTFVIEVHARRGAGRYAVELWKLPAERAGD